MLLCKRLNVLYDILSDVNELYKSELKVLKNTENIFFFLFINVLNLVRFCSTAIKFFQKTAFFKRAIKIIL